MLIQRVDWDCEVKTLFRDSNLGCKEAVASAIDWFFENVEEGIILEDDCLPEPDFFRFCSQLLERYRDEPSVMQIAGVNFQHGRQRGADSYYFSKYPHIWGWATWRRAWCHYDIAATGLDEFLSSSAWKQLCPLKEEAEYWAPLLRQVRDGHVDTWDFQWTYAVWKNSGLTAIPQVNLIANIGFRGDATHTVDPSTKLSRMATRPLADLTSGPTTLVADAEADAFTFLHTFTSEASRKALSRARKQIQPDNRLTKASKKESELSTIKSSLAWRVIGKPLYSIEKRLFKPSRKD
jgi:hypothetical protein